MRITWRGLELPTRVEKDAEISTEKYGRFVIEPFERGFGTTIGNSLRRILLSSLEGSAVQSLKVKGVAHEFSSIPGVMEDVTEIVLNVKSLIVRLKTDEPKTMKVSVKKAGVVTAADITADPAIEIINVDQVLATLTDDIAFEMEMVVESGRGYISAADRMAAADRFDQEAGLIHVDSVFSPVTRVRYTTEETRVGQRTNYDKLILEIWTNGTVSPAMALVEAGKILRKHTNPFVLYSELGYNTVGGGVELVDRKELTEEEKRDMLEARLAMPISELDLSVRAGNCLEAASINTLGQLVKLTEAELMEVPSFGKTTLAEVEGKLSELALSLGMAGVDEPTGEGAGEDEADANDVGDKPAKKKKTKKAEKVEAAEISEES